MPDPRPERPDVNDYLEQSDIIDYNHPLVEAVAEQLTYGLKDNLEKAQVIYDYVTDQIFHSFLINATSVTKRASEVLDKGHGICYAKAHLLAALMRASDIPAGFCYQIRFYDSLEQFAVHGFNAVFIRKLNRWIRIDATHPIDEGKWRLDPDREFPKLAIDDGLGEQDDFIVYLSPNKRVLKALTESETLDDLKLLLPSKL